MKKIFITASAFLFSIISTQACEICGCGPGNYYLGIMPQFRHIFFGIRYQFQNFHTIIASDPTQFSHDYYQTTELWGGWNITRKLQVVVLIPYNFIHQVSDDGESSRQGIGDLAAMVNYKVFDRMSALKKNKSISQQLWFGAGVKIPTGKFSIDPSDPEIVAIANFQTGTASTDFMLNAMYNITISKVGINSSASYKINTANNDKYTFGNKFSTNSIVYYTLKKNKVAIMPNVGARYETNASNSLARKTVAETGGHLFATSAGVEASFKKITVGTNVEIPLGQNFANGQTKMTVKGMMHITFAF